MRVKIGTFENLRLKEPTTDKIGKTILAMFQWFLMLYGNEAVRALKAKRKNMLKSHTFGHFLNKIISEFKFKICVT